MGADEAGALVVDTGEKRLNELGYKQTLKRELDYIMSFCTLISTMALPIALTSLYGLGYTYGGPVTIIWGWVVVSFFTMFVAVSLAEILSSLPTSGGIYYHAYYLGGKKWGKVAAWYTGWFNWLGYVAGYGSSGYFFSNFIAAMINLSGSSYSPSRKVLYGIACANFGCGVLLNLMPVRAVGRLSEISTVWNAALTLFFVVGLPAIAPTHQSASFVFTEFFDNSEALGLDTPFYLFCVGLLMSQFALGGFDLNGHLSEETKKSDSAAAWSTVMSTFTNALMGLAILLGLTFSIQDPDNVQNPDNETGGYYAGAQIIFDIFKARFGSGTGAVVFIGALVLCFPLSLATGACATARVVWAMSRDGATPFSFLWMKLHPKTKVPIMAVILTFAGMVIVLLPVIWSPVAFTAISSFTVMGVFLGCGVPILMKVTVSRNSFKPGPFSLGPFFGPLVNYVALAWIVTVTVVFSLPTVYPITTETFNYAPVALVALFVALTVPWLLPRTVFDFQGPRSNMTDFDMKEEGAGEGEGRQ